MTRALAFVALAFAALSASAQDAAQQAAPAQEAQQAAPAHDAQPAAAAADATADATVPAVPALPPLVKTDTRVGTGKLAMPGHTVRVHYTGWLHKPLSATQRGRKFDSSVERGEPIEFMLGAGKVIKGWDQGVTGMRVGGKRTLVIPSHLAYGARGAGGGIIPPDADLIFDVELVEVK